MPEKTYKMIELVGVSDSSMEDAIKNAVTRAGRTLKALDWFEVTQLRGLIQKGKVTQFQVGVKLGFRLMSDEELKGT
jgi:flavin-binding protein dodecin